MTSARRPGFANGLNTILTIGAAVAVAAAVSSVLLVRERDMAASPELEPIEAAA